MKITITVSPNQLGVIFSFLLAFTLVLEIILYVYANPAEMLKISEDKRETQNRSNLLQRRALTLIGIVIAVSTFIISNYPNVKDGAKVSVPLLGTSAGILLLSYQSKNLTGTREIWSVIQESSLEYGFLSFVIGSAVLFTSVAFFFGIVLFLFLVIIFSVRYYSVWREMKMYREMRKSREPESREGIE